MLLHKKSPLLNNNIPSHDLAARRAVEYRVKPLPALALLIVGNSMILGAYLDGMTSGRLILLCLALTIFSALLFGLVWFMVRWQIRSEQRAIPRITATYWACWPQFNNNQEWTEFAYQEYEQGRHPSSSLATALATLLVIFGLVAIVYLGTVGSELWFMLGLATAFLSTVAYSIIARSNIRKLNYLTLSQRLKAPPPRVYIAKDGIYNEDTGFESLRGLKELHLVDNSVSNGLTPLQAIANPPNTPLPSVEWSRLYISINRSSSPSSRGGGYYKIQFTILVPPGLEGEAKEVIKRYQAKLPTLKLQW